VLIGLTNVPPAKTAESIEMLFAYELTLVSQMNHVLNGDRDPTGNVQFWELSGPLKRIRSLHSEMYHSTLINGR